MEEDAFLEQSADCKEPDDKAGVRNGKDDDEDDDDDDDGRVEVITCLIVCMIVCECLDCLSHCALFTVQSMCVFFSLFKSIILFHDNFLPMYILNHIKPNHS